MIKVCCDICRADLPGTSVNAAKHYCDRCKPFSEEFEAETARMVNETLETLTRNLNRFRSTFVQTTVTRVRSDLKAVK